MKDSRECSRKFRGMLEKILGNVIKDSRKRSFWGMLEKFREVRILEKLHVIEATRTFDYLWFLA